MNQKLSSDLFLSRRSPDARKPSFHQQFQNQRRISTIVLLLAYFTGTNLRRIADPNVVSCGGGHLHKPLAVPARLHPNQGMFGQPTVKLVRFSRRMLQRQLSRFPRRCLKPTNLLPTGVVITSNSPLVVTAAGRFSEPSATGSPKF